MPGRQSKHTISRAEGATAAGLWHIWICVLPLRVLILKLKEVCSTMSSAHRGGNHEWVPGTMRIGAFFSCKPSCFNVYDEHNKQDYLLQLQRIPGTYNARHLYANNIFLDYKYLIKSWLSSWSGRYEATRALFRHSLAKSRKIHLVPDKACRSADDTYDVFERQKSSRSTTIEVVLLAVVLL